MHPKSNPTRPLRALLVAGALCGIAAPAAAQETPPAREVLDRYVEAVGGRAAVEGQRFRRSVSEMEMGNGMTAQTTTLQAAPDRMVTRMELPAMGMTILQGYDGDVGWSVNPMQGPTLVEGEALEEMRRQADFHGDLHPERLYSEMETVGRGEVEGSACWQVRLVTRGGSEAVNCYDVESGLLLSSTAEQEGPTGTMTATTRFYDYREFDGVRQPTRAVTEVMGQQMTLRILDVSHEPIADGEFALPPEIRTLVEQRGEG